MADLQAKFASLKQLAGEKKELKPILRELKLLMLQYPFLTQDEGKMPLEERVIFRDVLEYIALDAAETGDLKEFARVMRQLKSVYFRETDKLPVSEKLGLIMSVYLIYLITEAKLTEFNLEYPIIKQAVGESEYLTYAYNLEQAVSDNSFTRIFKLQEESPSTSFKVLIERILNGARSSYADSIEESYQNATIAEISEILHFSSLENAKAFAAERNWIIEKDDAPVVFSKKDDRRKDVDDEAARYVDLAVAISNLQ